MPLNRAVRVGLIYLVVSGLWIVFSDRLVFSLPLADDAQETIQTFKGLGFVLASTLLVTLLAWRELVRSRELARSDERYRELFDANPFPTWVFDRETLGFLEVNRVAVDRYGWSREEFLEMDLTDIRPAGDEPDMRKSVSETPPEGLHEAGIFRHLTREGRDLLVHITAHRVDFRGRDAELVVAEDVTERLAVEAQLRQAQRMESVGRLAGGVAHDFNNLLTVIGNVAAMAREEADPASREADALRQIEAAQQRGAALTRQLLTFSREAPTMRGRSEAGQCLRAMTEMLRPLLGDSVEVEMEIADGPAVVPLAPVHLEQIVMNLAVNARDAMPEGGRLSIYLDHRSGDDPRVRIRVVDTGTGMPLEVQQRIFEPFYTTKEVGRGTGLGLSTTYGLVTAAGGSIEVESSPGQGTTFTVGLPRLASDTIADEGPEVDEGDVMHAVAEPSGGAPSEADTESTVLVVEDEPALRSLMDRGLRRRGFRVLTAENGAGALDVLARREERVDLVLTDMVMPGISGAEFIEQVAAVRPGISTLLVSGYSAADVRDELAADQNFLAKPFTLGELVRAVEAAIER